MHHDDSSNEPTPLPDADPTPDDDLGVDPSTADTTTDTTTADTTTAAEEPLVDDPAIEDPAIEDPAIEDPAIDEPIADDDPAQQAGATHDPNWQPPPAATPPPPVRRLRRAAGSTGPGVAAGIARYYGIEAGLVKAAFIVATFFGGFGIFAYIAAWALIPKEHHPDPRPVVLNGGVAAIVIGTLALIGAASVTFGAGGVAGSLLAPALLIGLGFYVLDQRAQPQVVTTRPEPQGGRPTWVPPLTTTPLPPQAPGTPWANVPPQDPQPWGSVITEPVAPPVSKPRPPVTAVTMAITAAAVGALLSLDQFTSADVSIPQYAGTIFAIIVVGIIVSLFVGRAIGLWFAAIVALLGLAVSPIFEALSDHGFGTRSYTIRDDGDLLDTYELGAGELIIDMRDAEFTEDVDTSVDVVAGAIVVYVPDDVTVDVTARARFGNVIIPTHDASGGADSSTFERSGDDVRVDEVYAGREGAPVLTIEADVRFGEIEIRRG